MRSILLLWDIFPTRITSFARVLTIQTRRVCIAVFCVVLHRILFMLRNFRCWSNRKKSNAKQFLLRSPFYWQIPLDFEVQICPEFEVRICPEFEVQNYLDFEDTKLSRLRGSTILQYRLMSFAKNQWNRIFQLHRQHTQFLELILHKFDVNPFASWNVFPSTSSEYTLRLVNAPVYTIQNTQGEYQNVSN